MEWEGITNLILTSFRWVNNNDEDNNNSENGDDEDSEVDNDTNDDLGVVLSNNAHWMLTLQNLVWCILLQKPDGSLPSEEIGDRIATVLFYVSIWVTHNSVKRTTTLQDRVV